MGFTSELLKAFSPSHDAYIFMWILATLGVLAMLVSLERWLNLKRCTDYDALKLFDKVKRFIDNKQFDNFN